MKKYLFLTLTIVIGMLTGRVAAQDLDAYTFSTGTDATKWIPLTTTTTIITPGAVDGRASALQEIGFPFMFGEDSYTQFSVNTDGNLRLGSTVTGTTNYSNPFNATNANANNPKINFMGCDGYQTDSCYVYKELVGTAPNRILVVEFAMSTYNTTSRPSLLRWQVQLFEGSNNIQIVYAPTTPPILPNVARQVGMCINASDIWLVDANHQATHYTAGQTVTIASGNWPDVNRYYLFTAPVITCPRVYNLVAQTIASTAATIKWGSPVPSGNFILQVKPANDSWTSASVETYQLTDTFYQYTGLTPTTSYSARVALDCGGGDVSAWKEMTFTTSCSEIDTLPYFCDFETVEGSGSYPLPSCWTKGPQHANYPYRNTGANAYLGNGFLYFYTANMASLPPVDRSAINLNTTQVSFYARGAGFVLQVGMMTNPNDANTFVQIGNDITLTSNYAKYEIPLGTYTGTGAYVAFRNIANNYIYVDNVSLEEVPACARPVFLSITDSLTTQNSLQLTWTEAGTATEWMVEYGPAGFIPGNGTVESTTVPYVDVTNLSASSTYDFYVRSYCASGEMSEYSNKCSGTTLCGLISSLPFSENFDSYAGATSVSATSVLPNCWNNHTTGNYSGYAGYPYMYNYSTHSLSGNNSLYFSSYKTSATTYGGDEYVILPPIDTVLYPMNTLQLEFSARKRAENTSGQTSNYYQFILYVGVWSDNNTFTPVDTIEIASLDDIAYRSYIVPFSNFTGYGNRIALMAPTPPQVTVTGSSYGTYYYNAGHVDDIMISVIPSCPKPFAMTAYNELPYSVTVDWTPMGDETEWEIVAVPVGSNPDNGIMQQAFEHPFTYTGLTPSTSYDIYVRANCGNEYSPWSMKQTVTTKCAPVSVPYVENFDTYGTSTSSTTTTPGAFPTCWNALNNNTSPYPYISSNFHASGVGALYFYGTSTTYSYVASPAIDASQYAAGTLALRFNVMKTGESYGRLRVGVTTNPNYPDSMLVLKDFYPTDYESVNTWYPQMLVVPGHYDEPIYLVFYLPEGGSRYAVLDDVELDLAPQCPEASMLSVSQVTGSTALITWSPAPYNALNYAVQYSEQGLENWSVPVVAMGDHVMLTGLNPETFYDVRMYAECVSGSSDMLTATFRTGCLSGASDITIGTGTSTTNYVPTYASTAAASGYSLCQELWEPSELGATPGNISSISLRYAGSVDTTRNYNIYMMHSIDHNIPNTFMPMTNAKLVYSGNIRWMTGGDGWNTIVLDTVFPYNGSENLVITFDDNTGTPVGSTSTVKFYYTAHGSTTASQNNCHVVYKYLGTNLDPFDLAGTTGTRTTYRNNIRFGFECDPNVTCVAPNMLVTDVTSTSATLEWVAGLGENSWELQYKSAADADYTSEGIVTSSPTTIANLLPSQTYTFRMRSVCSAVDSSDWATVTVQTPCDYAVFPYTENFDSYTASATAASGIMPPCWTGLTNYATQKPHVSSVQALSGSGSLRLYGTSAYYGIAVMPLLDPSVLIDSLQVQFQVNATTAGGLVEVGVMSDPNDPSTFVSTGFYTPSALNTWEYAAINTNSYTGHGRYLAIRVPQNLTCTLYVDDITVRYIPSCHPVTDITVTQLTSSQADIIWTPGGTESSWNYFYGPADSVDISMASLSQFSNSNNLSLTDLSPQTTYILFVQSDCGDETSGWMTYSFTTPCLPMQLPYYENFEGYNGVTSYTEEVLPDCWSRINTGSYSYYLGMPVIYGNATYAQSGLNSLYFYTNQSMTTDYGNLYAILPEIDTDVYPLNTLQISFAARQYLSSYDCYLVVGAIEDITDLTTFVPVDTIQSTTTTYSNYTVSFASYNGTARHIALYMNKDMSTTTTNGCYVDDIVVETLPQCDAPTNLAASNITQTSVTVTWTPASGTTSWEVYAVHEGDMMTTVSPVVVNSATADLSGLDAGTSYDIYVRTICPNGSGYSNYTRLTFTTECYPFTQIPFEENFDSYSGVSATTTPLNNLPPCWHYINTGTNNYSGCPYIYSTTTQAASGLNTLRFYTGTPSAYTAQYAILPQIDVQQHPINTLQLQFDVRKNSTSYEYFALVVGVMTDPTDVTTFTSVDTLFVRSMDYVNEFVYFDHYQGTGSYIALLASDLFGVSYNGGYVDNISLSPMPSCLRVRNDLSVQSVGTDAVTLTWTPTGTEGNWIVEYRNTSDSIWLESHASSIPYTLGNLTPNTTYEIRVKADCGMGSVSDPSASVMVTTNCLPMSIPYMENFDSYVNAPAAATTNYLPSCWNYLNDGTNSTYAGCPTLYNGSSYANSGAISLKFFTGTATSYGNEYAILPAIDTVLYPIQNLQLSFWAQKSSTSYSNFTLVVGVISNEMDASTFTPCDTVVITSDNYENKVVFFRNWTGSGNRIALWAIKNNGVALNQGYVDDIAITVASYCLPVHDNVSVSNITATSANVTWTPNGTETEWLLRYKANQDQNYDTVLVTGSPTYALSNLTPNTLYALQVLASCGNGEYATSWTSLTLFTTSCSDITTLPYTENFEGVAGTTTTTENVLPDCWNYYNTGTSYTGMPQVYNGSTYAQGGTKSLKFYTFTSSAYSDQYAILPGIDPTLYPMNTLQISMGARRSSSTYNLMLIVGVMTDPFNIGTFQPVDTISPAGTAYSNFTVRFDHYTGTGKYIALKAPKESGTSYNEGYVDNIVVDVAPIICDAPTNVTVTNIQQTSATISWTPANGESDWELQYKTASGSWSNSINVTGTPSHTLTGLTENTQYEVRVRAVCDNTHSSDWSATATFTTLSTVTPPTVTTNDATNIAQTSATLNGSITPGSEAITAQGFEWKTTTGGTYTAVNATGTTMSYDLAGLSPNTSYTFKAFATTASGTTYGSEKTFTTEEQQQETCPAPTNVTVSDITTNSAVVTWTQPDNTASSWTVQYKQSAASSWNSATANAATYTLLNLEPATNYDVQVIANCTNGLTSDPSATVSFTTETVGIDDYTLDNSVVVYPNPTRGTVQVENTQSDIQQVMMYDAYGKMLSTVEVSGSSATIDLSGYADGLYFMRVTTDKGVVTKRVVKQ